MHYKRDETEFETTVVLIKKLPGIVADRLECTRCKAASIFLPVGVVMQIARIDSDRFRDLVETEVLHSVPGNDGGLMICCASLAAVLNGRTKNARTGTTNMNLEIDRRRES